MNKAHKHGRRDAGYALLAGLLLAGFLFCSCGCPHIQRIGNARFAPRWSMAPVELAENTLDRAYEPIALLDSDSYRADGKTSKTLMCRDLRKRARKVGADAVHKVRVLEVRKRGAVRDTETPLPGAWIQGNYKELFMRGEAVRYIKEGLDPVW